MTALRLFLFFGLITLATLALDLAGSRYEPGPVSKFAWCLSYVAFGTCLYICLRLIRLRARKRPNEWGRPFE